MLRIEAAEEVFFSFKGFSSKLLYHNHEHYPEHYPKLLYLLYLFITPISHPHLQLGLY
jgi:hypothetical protein